MRAKNEVDTRAGPFLVARSTVRALVDAVIAERLPCIGHVEQIDEEIVRELSHSFGKDAVLRSAGVRSQNAKAANENCHFRCGQAQKIGTVDQRFLRLHELLTANVIAEAVGARLERCERFDIRLFLRCVHASRRERHGHVHTRILRRLLNGRAPAEDDHVGHRDRFAKILSDRIQRRQDRRELEGLVYSPIPLRLQTNTCTVRAAAFV